MTTNSIVSPPWRASSVPKLPPVFVYYFVIDQLINLSFQLVQNGSKEKQLANVHMERHGWTSF